MFSLTNADEIKICSNHQEYQVPLIWTFKFRGAEFWCPYCGYQEGMFGAGTNVTQTDELKKRLELYKEASTKYLGSHDGEWKYKVPAEQLSHG